VAAEVQAAVLELALVGVPDAGAHGPSPLLESPSAPLVGGAEDGPPSGHDDSPASDADTPPGAVAVLEDQAPGPVAAIEVAQTVPAVEGVDALSPTLVVAARRPRRTLHVLGWVVLVVVMALVAAFFVQLARPLPAPAFHATVATSAAVAGPAPTLPWPVTGQAAVSVPALGVSLAPAAEPPVPIASLTKMMTAYLTLRDHPLAPDDQGPALTMTAADQAEAATQQAQGATSVPVVAGEKLTERQLLNGLMVHSANNFADVLARWDAGSVPAFVAKMNAEAGALHMTATHYADTNGLDRATVGSAQDELRVAAAAMAIPTFAAVVNQPAVTLPIAGVLPNYVSLVGQQGIVGVKSGFTQAAMGCLVLAGERTVDGHQVLVLAAVTGQPGEDPLSTASAVDLRLINAAAGGVRAVDVTAAGTAVGAIKVPWAHNTVSAVTDGTLSILAWPGQSVRLRLAHGPLAVDTASGSRVATLSATAGEEHVSVPVRTVGALTGPGPRWRLTRH